jgi:serine/threonine protein phosphatase 1
VSVGELPADQRVYCIGDIHGRGDLLQQLHGMILADAADFQGRKTAVYLGDYIDRGEQSRQVIDRLLDEPLKGFDSVYLRGNHEQAMLDFMSDPKAVINWLRFGGRETLTSYGIKLAHIPRLRDVIPLAEQLERALPESHREFLNSCESSWRCGSYYFVHAGIRPGVALERQVIEDQLWIREKFLSSRDDHGAVVVHGHSISTTVEMKPNRIGIDTGAFATGVLTCLVLEGSTQRLLQTGPG